MATDTSLRGRRFQDTVPDAGTPPTQPRWWVEDPRDWRPASRIVILCAVSDAPPNLHTSHVQTHTHTYKLRSAMGIKGKGSLQVHFEKADAPATERSTENLRVRL